MLSNNEIINIAMAAKADSVGYRDQIGKKRQVLLDYYNMRPYGNEIEGRSSYVSSEVSDVVETMCPILLAPYTSSYNVFEFVADLPQYTQEADQKTALANYAFHRLNDGPKVLHDAFKDGLLQYTGIVKVYWDDAQETTEEEYEGLSVEEMMVLDAEEGVEILEVTETVVNNGLPVYDAKIKRTIDNSQVKYDTVPPEEFLLSPSARDFDKPSFIGQSTPKRRSELLQMGFPREIVESLPAYEYNADGDDQSNARYWDQDYDNHYESGHKPNDIIYLTEMYIYIDADEDGIAELWQIFEAGNVLLEKNKVDEHPYCVGCPIPIPHKAIGTCPADQVADLQYAKSILTRHMLDNVYNTNYQRYAANDRVNLEDLLTPRPGGVVRIEGEEPIGDSVSPMVITPQVQQILQSIDFLDTSQEKRVGVTRFNQGLNPEALNQTATGFMGINEYSQQRVGLIASIFANGLVKQIGRKTIKLFEKHQSTALQVRLTGEPLEVDPSSWRHNLDCYVQVGQGQGARQEKLSNLNNILMRQIEAVEKGSPLADQAKIYNTLEMMIHELGLKDVSLYFNNPSVPGEILQAQNEQLTQQVQQLTMMVEQAQNQLAEAEQVRAQAELIKAQIRKEEADQKDAIKVAELAQKDEHFKAKLAQEDEHHRQEQVVDLTKLELDSGKDVPGSSV